MKKGTIIFIPFPYTNLMFSKNRPAVVISKANLLSGNIIVAFITSKIDRKLEADVEINESHLQFENTGLSKTSVIRCDKILTIDKNIILGEFGNLPDDILDLIDEKLKYVLSLNNS